MKQIIEWSDGNPGALVFLMSIMQWCETNAGGAITIIMKLEKATSIRGTNLYVLYSDLAGKDLEEVERICRNVPTAVLEDACSRQDRSGRDLIAPYLLTNN